MTKPNTWKDFIACAEYLIAEKYTSPEHLGIDGVSAGGILISNAITERPDLFGAAVNLVGVNPAVMLTHGINDPRVEPWTSAKMAARLQAATASDKPVLLQIDYDAGHGIGSTKRQNNELFADILRFFISAAWRANPVEPSSDKNG